MIDTTCYSEKSSVSIGFGFEPDGEYAKATRSSIDDMISEGSADSFWDNYEEFDLGIKRAKALLADGCYTTFRDALFEVFGKFAFSFEVNGVETKLDFHIDPSEIIYSLLEMN